MASTDCHDEPAAGGDRLSRILGNDGGSFFRGSLRVGNHVKRHSKVSSASFRDRRKGSLLRLLQVSTKLETHGRQKFVGVIAISPRTEPLIQRGGKNRGRNRLVDRGLDGPSTFA